MALNITELKRRSVESLDEAGSKVTPRSLVSLAKAAIYAILAIADAINRIG